MLLDARKSSLLVVDIQERLLPAMEAGNEVVPRTKILMQAAKALDVPIAVSEQYPKGLGSTVSALQDNSASLFEKMSFSIWRDEALKRHFIGLHEADRPLVAVAGIEAHVCVLQSALDLRAAGFGVYVVADAVSSRKQRSADLALNRMRDAGIQVVSTEMVVFEWLEKAGTAEFKALSALIK
jgi:nicotinamidase-related amidase